jgi:hypothetical protein
VNGLQALSVTGSSADCVISSSRKFLSAVLNRQIFDADGGCVTRQREKRDNLADNTRQ